MSSPNTFFRSDAPVTDLRACVQCDDVNCVEERWRLKRERDNAMKLLKSHPTRLFDMHTTFLKDIDTVDVLSEASSDPDFEHVNDVLSEISIDKKAAAGEEYITTSMPNQETIEKIKAREAYHEYELNKLPQDEIVEMLRDRDRAIKDQEYEIERLEGKVAMLHQRRAGVRYLSSEYHRYRTKVKEQAQQLKDMAVKNAALRQVVKIERVERRNLKQALVAREVEVQQSCFALYSYQVKTLPKTAAQVREYYAKCWNLFGETIMDCAAQELARYLELAKSTEFHSEHKEDARLLRLLPSPDVIELGRWQSWTAKLAGQLRLDPTNKPMKLIELTEDVNSNSMQSRNSQVLKNLKLQESQIISQQCTDVREISW